MSPTTPASSLYVQLSDWGYNYAAYLVQLPDTFEGTTLSLSDTTAFLFTGEQQQPVGLRHRYRYRSHLDQQQCRRGLRGRQRSGHCQGPRRHHCHRHYRQRCPPSPAWWASAIS